MAILYGIASGACIACAYQISQGSPCNRGHSHRGQNRVKFAQNEKYSAKSGDFLRFLLYLCHVIDEFQLLSIAALM